MPQQQQRLKPRTTSPKDEQFKARQVALGVKTSDRPGSAPGGSQGAKKASVPGFETAAQEKLAGDFIRALNLDLSSVQDDRRTMVMLSINQNDGSVNQLTTMNAGGRDAEPGEVGSAEGAKDRQAEIEAAIESDMKRGEAIGPAPVPAPEPAAAAIPPETEPALTPMMQG